MKVTIKEPFKALALRVTTDGCLEAGVDEAGRGCLAGPVVAAAVILPDQVHLPGLIDSKLLTHDQRIAMRPKIERQAIAWAIGIVGPDRIDKINILQATFEAMHQAVAQLQPQPAYLSIDGNRFRPFPGIAHCCEVKGDSRFLHIAAASVLAKTYRDDLMNTLHESFPAYHWAQNKGYPTQAHRAAIELHGSSIHHRQSFRLLR